MAAEAVVSVVQAGSGLHRTAQEINRELREARREYGELLRYRDRLAAGAGRVGATLMVEQLPMAERQEMERRVREELARQQRRIQWLEAERKQYEADREQARQRLTAPAQGAQPGGAGITPSAEQGAGGGAAAPRAEEPRREEPPGAPGVARERGTRREAAERAGPPRGAEEGPPRGAGERPVRPEQAGARGAPPRGQAQAPASAQAVSDRPLEPGVPGAIAATSVVGAAVGVGVAAQSVPQGVVAPAEPDALRRVSVLVGVYADQLQRLLRVQEQVRVSEQRLRAEWRQTAETISQLARAHIEAMREIGRGVVGGGPGGGGTGGGGPGGGGPGGGGTGGGGADDGGTGGAGAGGGEGEGRRRRPPRGRKPGGGGRGKVPEPPKGFVRAVALPFLSGLGLGSGSLPMQIAGGLGLLGGAAVAPLLPILAAGTGMALAAGVAAAMAQGRASYGAAVRASQELLPLYLYRGYTDREPTLRDAETLHVFPELATAKRESDKYKLFSAQEVVATMRGMARAVGHEEVGTLLPTSVVSGVPLPELVHTTMTLRNVAAGVSERTPGQLLMDYYESGAQPEGPGGLTIRTAFYQDFIEAATGVAAGMATGLSRAPVENVGAMLRDMSLQPQPGARMGTPEHLAYTTARLQATLGMLPGAVLQQSVLGDVGIMAISRLVQRDPQLLSRIAAVTGDPSFRENTYSNLERIAARSAELAARGETGPLREFFRAFREMFPDQEIRRRVLRRYGFAPEEAATLAREDLSWLPLAGSQPTYGAEDLRTYAEYLVNNDSLTAKMAQRIFNAGPRQENIDLNEQFAQVGEIMTRMSNSIHEHIVGFTARAIAEIQDAFRGEVQYIPP